MSTRSGKRIHSSFHENMLNPGLELVLNSERKTRSKRMKENIEGSVVKVVKSKKRTNYVSYPSEDDSGNDALDSNEDQARATRSLRNTAMKERNFVSISNETAEQIEVKKPVRVTRRTQKFPEDNSEDTQQNTEDEKVIVPQKTKKGKKKVSEPVEEEKKSKKKIKKKKKGRKSSSMIVEDIEPDSNKTNINNVSMESFHSAASSPITELVRNSPLIIVSSQDDDPEISTTFEPNNQDRENIRRRTRSISISNNIILPNTSNSIEKVSRKRKSHAYLDKSIKEVSDEPLNVSKKRKSSIKDTISVEADTTCEKEIKDSTFDLEDSEKRLSVKNTTFEKTLEKINTTYDKDTSKLEKTMSVKDTTFDKNKDDDKNGSQMSSANKSLVRNSIINTTYEKSENSSLIDATNTDAILCESEINTTYEKESEKDKTKSIQNDTFDKETNLEIINDGKFIRKSLLIQNHKLSTESLNSTFEKKSDSTFDKTDKLDSTFDKTEKLDSTFDKDKNLNNTFIDKKSKSSIISSDNSNITLDKSDVSRISITSDESKENIMNMTLVLIESSLEESQINASKLIPKSPSQAPVTPLKREGTFTKESPEEAESIKCKTPTKQLSLPSPGCTPFPTKSGSKERPELNVTRSIEKSRRSSLAEPLPRLTKVMFCSPVNNPLVVTQQRRKVIKSNLKGSNKSFVLDDTECRAVPRKRSYTHSACEGEGVGVGEGEGEAGAAVKRSRLTRPHSARARTTSASAKLSEPTTPSKKAKSSESRPARTKLPNFAALHQKQFDKMESLGECQERKAKRARQLLTPTGSVAVLDRSSPRVSDTTPEPPNPEPKPQKSDSKPQKAESKPQKSESKPAKESKNPVTPVKSLPTFKSLNPGYTRFGFKLNLDANPFSVPSKHDMSRSEGNLFSFSTKKDSNVFKFSSKTNGQLTRQATAPSLTGTTSARREVAKQTVMREKSFTDKRVVKRHESRNENRTIIKGVRTNRRFELQMRMRNLD